jgi:glycerol-3-phosphate dehydrogenase
LAYSGLRPRLAPPGTSGFVDFVIEPDREFPQIIQLIGMESPGLTAAPAIAQHVRAMVAAILN